MEKQIHAPNHVQQIRSELTIVSITAEIFDQQYGKYMDSKAKQYLELIKKSVKNINTSLDSI